METGIEEISKEVMTIPEQAHAILVRNPIMMAKANSLFLIIRGLRKKIDETFTPIIEKAHAAHKEAIAQKKKVEEPLVTAESWLNAQMTAYKLEQDRIRREEEERLRQIAIREEMERRKAEEARRIEEAALLEQAGAKDEAEQVMAEIIQETAAPVIIETPVSTIPKIEMKGMAMVTYWHFRIKNEALIPRNLMMPNEKAIRKLVDALQDKANIPGIEIYPETKARPTGR